MGSTSRWDLPVNPVSHKKLLIINEIITTLVWQLFFKQINLNSKNTIIIGHR
jgi:hypothetical protein